MNSKSVSLFSIPPSANRILGREMETQRLNDALQEPGLIVLWGPGGVGKSTMLRTLAVGQRALLQVDGSQVVDAKDFESILADLLGVRTSSIDFFRNTLDEQEAVLVIDDLEGWKDDALALLRSLSERVHSSNVVVTSRSRLGSIGEQVIPILPFDTKSEIALRIFESALHRFGRQSSLNNDEVPFAKRICDLSAGMPFTLELCAAACIAEPLSALVRELEEDVFSLDHHNASYPSLERMVHRSFQRLDGASAQALARLAALPLSGFASASAELVLDLPTREAKTILRALLAKSLVHRPSESADHYSLLPEIAWFAQKSLPAETLRAAERLVHDFASRHTTDDLACFSLADCRRPYFHDLWKELERLQKPMRLLANEDLLRACEPSVWLDFVVACFGLHFSGSPESGRTWAQLAARTIEWLDDQLSPAQLFFLKIALARRQMTLGLFNDSDWTVLERLRKQLLGPSEKKPTWTSQTAEEFQRLGQSAEWALLNLRGMAAMLSEAPDISNALEVFKRAARLAEDGAMPHHAAQIYSDAIAYADLSDHFRVEDYRSLTLAAERCARQAGLPMPSSLEIAKAKNHYASGRPNEAASALENLAADLREAKTNPWYRVNAARNEFIAKMFRLRDAQSEMSAEIVRDGRVLPLDESRVYPLNDLHFRRFTIALNLLHRHEIDLAQQAFEMALAGAEQKESEKEVALCYALLGLSKTLAGHDGSSELAMGKEMAWNEILEVQVMVRACTALTKSDRSKREAMDEMAKTQFEIADHLLIVETLRRVAAHDRHAIKARSLPEAFSSSEKGSPSQRHLSAAEILPPVGGKPRKEDELFAYLWQAMHERPQKFVAPKEIATFLWNDSDNVDEENLRNRVRVLMHKLRKRLVDHSIVANQEGAYRLEANHD